MEKVVILNNQQINQKINRIAYQIYEDNYLEKELIVVGIETKGIIIAKMLTKKLQSISKITVRLASLSIDKNEFINSVPQFSLDTKLLSNKVVILVDDVLNTGKTLIYGVKYLLQFPVKKMSTTVLVDRNHKRYPIGTHYVGLSLSTTLQNHISIDLKNNKVSACLS